MILKWIGGCIKIKLRRKNGDYFSPLQFPGYMDSENLWNLVCDLNSSELLMKSRKKRK